MFDFTGKRSDNFIVGLRNTNPPSPGENLTLWDYTLCGQYPGVVPRNETATLYCQQHLQPFRYVILQFPRKSSMNFREVEIYTFGL